MTTRSVLWGTLVRYYQVYLVVTGDLAWPVVATPADSLREEDWPGAELRLMGVFGSEAEAFALFDRLLAHVPTPPACP